MACVAPSLSSGHPGFGSFWPGKPLASGNPPRERCALLPQPQASCRALTGDTPREKWLKIVFQVAGSLHKEIPFTVQVSTNVLKPNEFRKMK